MRLEKLLEDLEYVCIQGSVDVEVEDVVYDTRKGIRPGSLFVCIRGRKWDGHGFSTQAAGRGAAALVVSEPVEGVEDLDVTVIQVPDTRYALAVLSAAWFGHPAEKMQVIGITGTKGKTTTTYLVKSILEHAGFQVGLMGTTGIQVGDCLIQADNTTPESYVIQENFARMYRAGIQIVVMEVSSQALKQHRTEGFVFDYGIFTNLGADHIAPGEHASLQEYMACKGMLFRQCRMGIVNGDDAHVAEVTQGHTCRLETYGMGRECMLRAGDLRLVSDPGRLGVAFQVSGLLDMEAQIAMPGRFSVYNALCAIALCRHFGVPQDAVQQALLKVQVKGRIEKVELPCRFTLLIDYAHNAMALENLLGSLREYRPRRLVCLFGCGGDRAKGRRYEMGEVSGRMADMTILTSDNPRTEEPDQIIRDIETGILPTGGKYLKIRDRREAIFYALSQGQEGDIIVLAGKGHEDYQEIQGVKYHMDERQIVREWLACREV